MMETKEVRSFVEPQRRDTTSSKTVNYYNENIVFDYDTGEFVYTSTIVEKSMWEMFLMLMALQAQVDYIEMMGGNEFE